MTLRHAGRDSSWPEQALPMFENLLEVAILMSVKGNLTHVVCLMMSAGSCANFIRPIPGVLETWYAPEDALTKGLGQQVASFSIHQVTLGLKGLVNTDTLETFQQRKRDANSRDILKRTGTFIAQNKFLIRHIRAKASESTN